MDKKRLLRYVGVVLIVSNLVLALLKTGAWIYTDSLSLQSEAVNSWVDTVYSIVLTIGIYMSTRDPNDRYPEGHHRLEPFVGLLISIAIIATAITVSYDSVQQLLGDSSSRLQNIPVGITVLGISGLVKYGLFRYCADIDADYGTPMISAVAKDNRNDLLTIVVAFIGIIGSYVGLNSLDAIAAIVVAMAIGYSGVEILGENIGYVLGRAVDDDIQTQILDSVRSTEEIKGVHDVQIHYSGAKIDVSMHLEIDGGITIEEAHRIETDVGDSIRDVTDQEINEINLHIDPYTLDEWRD